MGAWRKVAWLLKNSHSSGNGQNLGDMKCLEIREDRLKRFVTQFCFCDFRPKEFFNSHSPLHSLTPEWPITDRRTRLIGNRVL
jgi:hypothetical protein